MTAGRARSLGGSFDLALAKAVPAIPAQPGLRLEPKLDGFRAAIVVEDGMVRAWSRNGTDLTPRFPELERGAGLLIPEGCVVDGEIVSWSQGRMDFASLQRRMGAGPALARQLAAEQPASFIAFDILAVLGRDVRLRPLSERRALLEELAAGFEAPLELCPSTFDRAAARQWWDDPDQRGFEGLLAKPDAPYKAGRIWFKSKRRSEADAVCGAVVGSRTRPDQLVLGLYDAAGELRFAGRTAPLTPAQAARASPFLRAPAGEHPWPEEVPATALDRFARDRGPVRLTLVEPVAVEVSADAARTGIAFRHSTRLHRFRPDLDPHTITAQPR
jgi:ATP-dependent DNA ligase